jgi:hypothetical protein
MVVSQLRFQRIEERIGNLEESLDLLADKKLLASIRKSLDDIKAGKYSDYDNVTKFKKTGRHRYGL